MAYKKISLDRYVIGDQDWADGNLVNDDATILVRITEGYDSASGTATKVNQINVYYGDQTRFPKQTRVRNEISYDIEHLREKYSRSTQVDPTNFEPRWPTRRLENWAAAVDYFSHIQDETITIYDGRSYDCDWTLNPSATSGYDGNQPTFVLKKDIDGTIILSDYVTPDTGTDLSFPKDEADVCLHGYGNVSYAPFAVVGFNEFALKFYYAGHVFGGFMPAIQE